MYSCVLRINYTNLDIRITTDTHVSDRLMLYWQHYSVYFFFKIFLFYATIIIEGEGIGARSVRFPHRFYVCPTRSRKWGIWTQGHVYVWSCLFPLNHTRSYMVQWEETASYVHMALSSNPSFSRAGQADTKTVWEPYRSCTDTLTLDHNRDEKEENRKEVDGVL